MSGSRRTAVITLALFTAVISLCQAANANECSPKRIKVSAVCGRVQGTRQTKVGGLEVSLVDDSGAQVQQTQTDAEGKFEFRNARQGKYKLRVDARRPFWVMWPIEVSSNSAKECRDELVVSLDPALPMGACLDQNRVEKQKLK